MTPTAASRATAPDVAAPLDLLLADAATGISRRFRPLRSTIDVARALAARPGLTVRHGGELARQVGRIVAGRSEVAPAPRDRRFSDPAWTTNPLLRRIVQTYVATSETAEQVLVELELEGRDGERVRFAVSNLVDAAAPSNNPLLNPAALKEFIDTGGASATRGARAFIDDISAPPRVPSMVEPDAFEVGRDLAATPGSVVHRTALYELIQFTPQTAKVRTTPLLIVPPTINKYYILDLAPGRSVIEFLVAHGFQVFVMSWRNPDSRFADNGLDAYGADVIDAMATARAICRTGKVNVVGVCSGGIIASMVAAHLAATGDRQVSSLTLLVTVLDQARAGVAGAFIDESTAEMAMRASAKQGFLDGRALAEVFAWLRPNDLIWNYWVNNYLLGRRPPPFDILYWNADTTRMPARMHHDFLRIALDNALVTPAAASMLDTPVDLADIASDSYVLAGVADHICPWQSCFQSTQLLGGTSRFVLSNSGHIAALVNPPDNPKAGFQAADGPDADPDAWAHDAERHNGSWWLDYAEWLGPRSGRLKAAPRHTGAAGFEPGEAAPGTYVLDH